MATEPNIISPNITTSEEHLEPYRGKRLAIKLKREITEYNPMSVWRSTHGSCCLRFLWVYGNERTAAGEWKHFSCKSQAACFTWKRRPCSLVSLVSEVQEDELSRELLLPPVGRSWQHFPNILTWPSVLCGVKTKILHPNDNKHTFIWV